MSLFEEVKADLLAVRKLRNTEAVKVLSTFVGDLETKAKNAGQPVADEEVIKLAKSRVKSSLETAKLVAETNAGYAGILEAEALFYDRYVPKQLSVEEIKLQIQLLSVSIASAFNLGKVQSFFKTHFLGRYDAEVVKDVFQKLAPLKG